MDIVVLL